jgi:hypothetical protein
MYSRREANKVTIHAEEIMSSMSSLSGCVVEGRSTIELCHCTEWHSLVVEHPFHVGSVVLYHAQCHAARLVHSLQVRCQDMYACCTAYMWLVADVIAELQAVAFKGFKLLLHDAHERMTQLFCNGFSGTNTHRTYCHGA